MDPHLWLNHGLKGYKVLGFGADGFATLEHCPFLEPSIRAKHDGPGMNSAALFGFPRGKQGIYSFGPRVSHSFVQSHIFFLFS